MTIDLKAGIVRVLKPNGEISGTAFVATCAHAVEAAGARPEDTVHIVFHATEEKREAQVEAAWWRAPDAEDVAILHLGSSASVEGVAGQCEIVGRTTEKGFPVLQLRS
jgi:hypothetical protein